nr:SWIM zinc finger family protein [Candidatus Sigynarchaeota archaeon]
MSEITEREIEKMAAYPAIYERGYEYHSLGSVENLRVTGNRIHASIDGNFGQYTVDIELVNGKILASCDCPFGGPGCKHIVAVLLDYLYKSKKETLPQIGDDPDGIKNLKNRIGQLQKADLRDVLVYLHKRFPETRRIIEEKLVELADL